MLFAPPAVSVAEVNQTVATLSGYMAWVYPTTINLAATGDALVTLITGASGWLASQISAGGVSQATLNATGAKITSVSGWAASATDLTTTGVSLGSRIDTVTTNLAATGATLEGHITGVSGWSLAVHATILNLAATGSTLDGRANTLTTNLVSTGSTLDSKVGSLSGWAASAAAVATTGSTLDGRINTLTTNLASSGSTLDSRVTSLSGWSASVVNLASTGSTLDTKVNSTNTNLAATGSTLDGRANTLTTNLATTGSTLDARITSASGYGNATFATIVNATLTGQTLMGRIDNVSGNVTSTGATLFARDGSISGALDTRLGATGALLSAVSVSGGTTIQNPSFTGVGQIVVTQFGTVIQISGVSFGSGQALTLGALQVSTTGIANKPTLFFTETGWGPTFLGPALWSKQMTAILPAATTTQTVLGDTTTNVGTVSTISSEVLGNATDFTPTTTGGFLTAGTASTTAHVYRGSTVGRNGFFFVSKFALNSGNGTQGSFGAPSGSRLFVGLTDQTVTPAVITNDPAGNRVGLSFIWASGGSQTNRFDANWQITAKDNANQFLLNTPMGFQTGFYRFSMYCKPYPDCGTVWWQLDDLLRASGCAGTITGNLPVGSTAMRPLAAVCAASGIKGLKTSVLYVETLGSPLD